MSGSSISWRRIKSLNRKLDERFVHATTSNTGEWWWWHCIRHDGSSALVNTRTLDVEPYEGIDTSTKHLLRDREIRYSGAGEWLAELDKRAGEIAE